MSVDDMDAVDKIVIERNHTINGIAVFAKKAEPKGSGGRGRGGRGGRGKIISRFILIPPVILVIR